MTTEEWKIFRNETKNRICRKCKSAMILPHERLTGVLQCQKCGCIGHAVDFPKLTVFDQITESPEVLADKLVYEIHSTDPVFGGTYYWWCSTVIPGEKWVKKEDAIAATLERLKEVVE